MPVTSDPSTLAIIELLLTGFGRTMLRMGAMLFLAYLLTLVFSLTVWKLQSGLKPRRVAPPATSTGPEHRNHPERLAVGAARAA